MEKREIKSRTKGRLLVMGTAMLWGLSGVCTKSIAWGSLSIVCISSIISFFMMAISKKSIRLHVTKENLIGGLMLGLTNILAISAIKLTTAGTAIVLQYVSPILVFLYEIIFHHKKPKMWEVILTGLAFSGIVMSFADSMDMTRLLGNIIALGSGFTVSAYVIIMNGNNSDSADCTALGNLQAFIITLVFMLTDSKLTFDRTNIIWVLIFSVVQCGLANILFAKGCKLVSSIECSLLLTLEPILNPIYVFFVTGERMGKLAIVGAVVVIVAATLYSIMPDLLEYRKSKQPLT